MRGGDSPLHLRADGALSLLFRGLRSPQSRERKRTHLWRQMGAYRAHRLAYKTRNARPLPRASDTLMPLPPPPLLPSPLAPPLTRCLRPPVWLSVLVQSPPARACHPILGACAGLLLSHAPPNPQIPITSSAHNTGAPPPWTRELSAPLPLEYIGLIAVGTCYPPPFPRSLPCI